MDEVIARGPDLERKADMARAALADFMQAGPGYVSTSWGKDSVVVAHMARQIDPSWPLVWVRTEPIFNPDCLAVRDAFLASHPGAYDEIVTHCTWDGERWLRPETKRRHEHGPMASGAGFEIAAERYGDRYVSGVRGEEAKGRAMRMYRWGTTSKRTCAPVGWWRGLDVFAYLALHDLPVHPAYACTFDGSWDRDRIRVGSLGGKRGGWRRQMWERRYYAVELGTLAAGPRPI